VTDASRTTGYMVMRSVAEAARECGVTEGTVRRWIAEGAVSAIEIGGHPMVNAAEVATVRDRRGEPRGDRRWRRTLGAANLALGAIGCLVFVGVGPGNLREWWWAALCLASVVIGLLVWRSATRPSRGRWTR